MALRQAWYTSDDSLFFDEDVAAQHEKHLTDTIMLEKKLLQVRVLCTIDTCGFIVRNWQTIKTILEDIDSPSVT